jgi:hypothetical protein
MTTVTGGGICSEGRDAVRGRALLEVYRAVFERIIPLCPDVPVRCAEVFRIAPERYDPFAPGLRKTTDFPDAASLPTDRPYPIRAGASAERMAGHLPGALLRVYLAPVEWQGGDDALVEAGVSIDGERAAHWVWRLGRVETSWVVLRCELVWCA